jgi:hypothetical protein
MENVDLKKKLEVLTEQFNYKVTSKTTDEKINTLYRKYVTDYVKSLGLGLSTRVKRCGNVVVYVDNRYTTYTIDEIIENGITQIELEIERYE